MEIIEKRGLRRPPLQERKHKTKENLVSVYITHKGVISFHLNVFFWNILCAVLWIALPLKSFSSVSGQWIGLDFRTNKKGAYKPPFLERKHKTKEKFSICLYNA